MFKNKYIKYKNKYNNLKYGGALIEQPIICNCRSFSGEELILIFDNYDDITYEKIYDYFYDKIIKIYYCPDPIDNESYFINIYDDNVSIAVNIQLIENFKNYMINNNFINKDILYGKINFKYNPINDEESQDFTYYDSNNENINDIILEQTKLCYDNNNKKLTILNTRIYNKYYINLVNNNDIELIEFYSIFENNFIKIILPNSLLSIGNNILYNCTKLKKINLSNLDKLERIGDNFINHSTKLEYINLSNLLKLTIIGDKFLYYCRNLKNIDLYLPNLTTIGNNFLSNCSEIKNIDLSSLQKLTTTGDNFLSNCSKIRYIDLSSLINLITIGDNFLYHCSIISSIDLSPLIMLEIIGNNFLNQLNSFNAFTKIILNNPNLKHIGNKFLLNCYNTIEVNLSSLINLKTIGDDFLVKLLISSIDLSSLINLESIGKNFLSFCFNLKEIDLSFLINLKTIESGFLHNCNNLKKIKVNSINSKLIFDNLSTKIKDDINSESIEFIIVE